MSSQKRSLQNSFKQSEGIKGLSGSLADDYDFGLRTDRRLFKVYKVPKFKRRYARGW